MQLKGRVLAWYFAAWIPFAVLYGFAVALSGVDLADAARSTGVSVGSAAVFSLLAWTVARRWTRSGSGLRWLLVHLSLAVMYSAAWTAVIAIQIKGGAPAATWEGFVANAIRWQFVSGVVLYAFVAAALSFIDTNSRLRAQVRQTERAEQLRIAAELQALRAQLNPHFLFNTLHSITALVRERPASAERALEQLAACLRHVLDIQRDAADEVSLGDELAFVRDYLALEHMRFGDRLAVVEHIDPDALDASVLAFVLQPLVENAIRHGLSPVSRRVTVRLAAMASEEMLLLEVGDDGPGATGAGESTRGVGLRAVRERLRTRYGATATMEVITAPNEGFLVRIRLPLESAPRRVMVSP